MLPRMRIPLDRKMAQDGCDWVYKGALKGTNLKGQTEPNRRFSLVFADSYRFSRLFLENKAFGKRRLSQRTADVRRKLQKSGTFKRGVTEKAVFTFACQYVVSPRGRTGNRTVTQMRRLLLPEGRPNCARQSLASTLSAPCVNCARQSLASTLSAPCVAATDLDRHANVVAPCLLTPCLNVPNLWPQKTQK